MKAILQRVKCASVTVNGQVVSAINKGLLVLVAVAKNDTAKDADSLASRILRLRLWDDGQGNRWKLNVKDINGEILCGDEAIRVQKGNKPDFHMSASAEEAKSLYQRFFNNLKSQCEPDIVKDGVFQATMDVNLTNDGPVTVEVNTERVVRNDVDVPSQISNSEI